ncbi:MAG TPA: glycosyltransferase family 2 protein [Candidatus Solibacter sp.]|nr:glycosyltransferase family 2 protein [Candidatus Solibacter sp.]
MSRPRFSVCIPTYEMHGRGVVYLNELFESLKEQSYGNYEVIVSDHSLDDSIQSLCSRWTADLPLKYLRNSRNRGNSPSNINHAIAGASGEYIKPLYQDDLFHSPSCLERIDETLLETHASWGACGFVHLDGNGRSYFRYQTPFYLENVIVAGNTIGAPSVVFFKNEPENEFDERLVWMHDAELYYRLRKKYGPPAIVEGTLVAIRQWSGQVTNTLATRALQKRDVRISLTKHGLWAAYLSRALRKVGRKAVQAFLKKH